MCLEFCLQLHLTSNWWATPYISNHHTCKCFLVWQFVCTSSTNWNHWQHCHAPRTLQFHVKSSNLYYVYTALLNQVNSVVAVFPDLCLHCILATVLTWLMDLLCRRSTETTKQQSLHVHVCDEAMHRFATIDVTIDVHYNHMRWSWGVVLWLTCTSMWQSSGNVQINNV